MIETGELRLVGEQIQLRPMELKERQRFFEWATRSASTPFWYGELYGDEIPSYIVFKLDWPNYYFDGSRPLEGRSFAVLLDEQAIGQINYNEIDLEDQSVSLDILIPNPTHHGLGYGSQAIRLLTSYLISELQIRVFRIEVSPQNPKAIGAYRKVGYRETGRFVRNRIPWIIMELMAEHFVPA